MIHRKKNRGLKSYQTNVDVYNSIIMNLLYLDTSVQCLLMFHITRIGKTYEQNDKVVGIKVIDKQRKLVKKAQTSVH